MIKVGVTGGIGSGKTTFCKALEKLGSFVLYADDFAKELMVTDQKLKHEIIEAFGTQSYSEKGELNRSYLAEQAFSKNRVEELNAIVHPILWERVAELMCIKEEEGLLVFVKEAAILLNNGRPTDLDFVVLVKSPREKRIQRVQERDNTTEQLVTDRIDKQPNFDELETLCDFVIDNSGTLEELNMKALALFEEITKK